VPLWRKARRVFDPYMEARRPDVFLFPNKSDRGPIAPSKVQEACRHLASLDPSLKHLTPHVLRHTFATMALLNCHDIKRTQEILGHGKKGSVKIPVVMLRYLHPDVSENGGKLQHSKMQGALVARRNPEQTTSNGAGMVSDEIYERLKREGGMLPVPGKRGRVYVYSHRRGDVVEVSEARARTWLTLGETARDLREVMASGIRQRYRPAPAPAAPTPAAPSAPESLNLFAPEPPQAPKRTRKKAKENPMRDDDWYWKAIYSNVPPGPSRAHPVAQRNGSQVLHTVKGQPYKYVDGRPRFISKVEAASIQRREKQSRRNPDDWSHSHYEQIIDPFSVSEARTFGEQPIARRNKSRKAKKNGVVRVYQVK